MVLNSHITRIPSLLELIEAKTVEIGFTMPSNRQVGSLLQMLTASKPDGRFLELGTGTGLALAWMVEGMDDMSTVISVDNDRDLIAVADSFFKTDERVVLVCSDGSEWIQNYNGIPFDLIFADAWPGKYSDLEETMALLKPGGYYVIDDMNKQPNWPEGHEELVVALVDTLETRNDFHWVKMDWSTGIMIGVKK